VQELRGVLIPTGMERLLLPNTAVVEVIDFRDPEPFTGAEPDWGLGLVTWQRRTFPVIAAEMLLGGDFDPLAPRLRIAVCHSLLSQKDRPFLGIVSQGIPRLVRVSAETIEESPGPALADDWPILAQVFVNDVFALIPDVEKIERMLNGVD
jgi:chemosensory pili system protein ChpC